MYGLIALVGVVVLLSSVAHAGLSRYELQQQSAPGELIDVGGFRLHLWCIGIGSPTVLFENGLGDSAVVWGYVHQPVSEFTRACVYDRAGIGYSDEGPSPRSAERAAEELHVLLARAGIVGGVVAVPSSYGGLVTRLLEARDPRSVAAMVLVDTSHEEQRERFEAAGVSMSAELRLQRIAPALSALLPATGVARLMRMGLNSADSVAPGMQRYARAVRFQSSGIRTTLREFAALPQSIAVVRETRRRINMPVIVLSRTQDRDTPVGKAWQEMQADLATLSTQSCRLPVEGAGHIIAASHPRSVITATRLAVDAVRGRRAPNCSLD